MAQPQKKSTLSEQAHFLGRMIANPKRVGAIAPSGRSLARAMVSQIDFTLNGPVLELGPGQGSMTREILARGFAPGKLILVERDPAFLRILNERFPGVNIMRGDAFDLAATLGQRYTTPFAAIISGIPLLNHDSGRRHEFVESAMDRLLPGAPLIQFSYGLQKPAPAPKGVQVRQAAFVLRNLPPARVWVYRRTV